MEVVPNPKHQKYSRSEIVVSIIKCTTLGITLLGITFILSIHPQVVNCQCPAKRKGSYQMTTKAPVQSTMYETNVEEVMNVTKQFQERSKTITEVKVEALTGQVTTYSSAPNLTLDLNKNPETNFNYSSLDLDFFLTPTATQTSQGYLL